MFNWNFNGFYQFFHEICEKIKTIGKLNILYYI